MRLQAKVTFAMRELDRLKCIQGVVDGELRLYQAAERLGLTTRQMRRLVRRYDQEGPVGLISRHRNRPGNRRLKAEVAEQAFAIIRERYADFGPTLAAEKLRTRHSIDLAKETVRRLQIASGMWIPRKLRPPKVHQPRARRACVGELVQIDGCEHRWFEDRAPVCTALVYVDDATSALKIVSFSGSESTFAYFEATRQYIERYGQPLVGVARVGPDLLRVHSTFAPRPVRTYDDLHGDTRRLARHIKRLRGTSVCHRFERGLQVPATDRISQSAGRPR